MKENRKLESRFARHLADMANIKHNSGFALKYMNGHICEFDGFCVERFPEKDALDFELVEGWVHSSQTKSQQEIEKRYRTMKHLGEYMLSQGLPAYISTVRIRKLKPAEPYIFTDEQLSSFFHACDGYPKLTFPAHRHIVVPVLFRTIYCGTVCSIFDHVLARTPFFGKTSKKPTCHSLRHTFAVNSMRQCIKSGGNFDDSILYLYRYMGHSAPQETMYYLHLSVNLAQDIRKNAEGFEDVMGGVWHVEE